MPKFVVSATLEDPAWNNTTVLTGDLAEEVGKLKQRFAGDILVTGSGQLVASLLAHDLDELHLIVYPIVLGSGKRLFDAASTPARLQLVNATKAADCVILTYQVGPGLVARCAHRQDRSHHRRDPRL